MDFEQTLTKRPGHDFDHTVVVGAVAKEIVRSLLESCGYMVYPFGYESTFSVLKRHLVEGRAGEADQVQRVRSMPDFIVSGEGEIQLVEVKFRRMSTHEGRPGVRFRNAELGKYKRFWPESVIALVSPHGDKFFTRPVKDLVLGPFEAKWFDYTEFAPLPTVFRRVSGKHLQSFHAGVEKLARLWDDEE
jgi:hypothetical protein